VGYENLLATDESHAQAYLHNSPRTFNNAASAIDIAGLQAKTKKRHFYSKGISFFDSLYEEAKKRENDFFKHFPEANTAELWSDKYLARIGENASPYQQVLAAWNSAVVENQLKGLDSKENIIKKLRELFLSTDAKKITKKLGIEKHVNETLKELENKASFSVREILYSILIEQTKGKKTSDIKEFQHYARNLTEGSKKRTISSRNSAILKELEEKIIFTHDRKGKKEIVYNVFLQQLSYNTKKSVKELEKNKDYIPYLKIIKQLLEDAENNNNKLFAKNTSVIIGEVEEVGDGSILSIPLELDFGRLIENDEKRGQKGIWSTGAQKIQRLSLPQKVDSKIDMLINLPEEKKKIVQQFRFQQKNTNKDVFFEFEKLGEQFNFSNKNIFFNVGSEIKYHTFIQQLVDISKQGFAVADNDTLGILAYLLVNLNVLNQQEGKNKLYKQDTLNRPGLLLTQVNDTISKIISLAALLLFSDFEGELGAYVKTTYDFIIFNSRFLIPMSQIYEALKKSLENYSQELSSNTTHINAITRLKTVPNLDELADQKKEAVGKFDKTKQYSDMNLVSIGKNAGKEVLDNLTISNFELNINIENFLNSKNLASMVPILQ
jgi:hypothetical protein